MAILVIAAIALFFTLRGNTETNQKLGPEISPVKNYMDDCLEGSLETSIRINAFRGGHNRVPEESIIYSNEDLYRESKIPYYLSNAQSLYPSKKELEKELSESTKDLFVGCIGNNLSVSDDISYNTTKMKAETKIGEKSVISEINMQTSITRGNSTEIVDTFDTEVNSEYGRMYNIAVNLTEEQERDITDICISCFNKKITNSGYNASYSELNGEENYILITAIKNNEEATIFTFAHKFEREVLENVQENN